MSFTSILRASALAGLLMTGAANAATITFDFEAGGSFSGSGLTNSYSLTTGGLTVTVTGWALTGTTYTRAQVVLAPPGQGLGVCNATEGLDCGSAGTGNVDNVGTPTSELLLFQLSGPASFVNAVLDPFNVGGSPDRDASYWIGTPALPGDLIGGETVATLNALFGVAAPVTVDNPLGSDELTFTFAGSPSGNALLLGPAISQNNDNFRVETLTVNADVQANPNAVVPEPITIGLLGAGLVGLGFAARRRRAA